MSVRKDVTDYSLMSVPPASDWSLFLHNTPHTPGKLVPSWQGQDVLDEASPDVALR